MGSDDIAVLEAVCNGFERWIGPNQSVRHVELISAENEDSAIILMETSFLNEDHFWCLVDLHRKHYYRIGRKIWYPNYCADGSPTPYKNFKQRPTEEQISMFLSGQRDMPSVGPVEAR